MEGGDVFKRMEIILKNKAKFIFLCEMQVCLL